MNNEDQWFLEGFWRQ